MLLGVCPVCPRKPGPARRLACLPGRGRRQAQSAPGETGSWERGAAFSSPPRAPFLPGLVQLDKGAWDPLVAWAGVAVSLRVAKCVLSRCPKCDVCDRLWKCLDRTCNTCLCLSWSLTWAALSATPHLPARVSAFAGRPEDSPSPHGTLTSFHGVPCP